jgi:hypothetical protein
MMNLQELLDSMDVFRQLTGLRLQDLYNTMLKKGWTLGSPQLTAGMHLVIRLFHRKQVRMLEAILAQEPPRPGGFAGTQLQSRHWREPAPRAARHAAGHHPHRSRRLSAAFLDRAAAAAFHLRIGPRRGAGARDGPRGRPRVARFRHDSQPALL